MIARPLLLPLLLLFQAGSDESARSALGRFSDRFRDLTGLSASFTQSRRSALLNEPIKSSGKLHYRRDPAHLVFEVEKPHRASVHFDGKSYQVYRPDEKQLEQFEIEDSEISRWLFMAFNPKIEEIEKSFIVKSGTAKEETLEVVLVPSESKLLKVIAKLTLLLSRGDAPGDPLLRQIGYVDPDQDELSFEISNATLNPSFAPETFELKLPEGARVLKHKKKTNEK
jgi:outer membrane lipoprotein-sorting protein